MDWLEIILGIIGSASVIGNVVQFVTLRETKAKAKYEAESMRYEADNAHISALQKVIELQSEEIRRLQDRVEKLEMQIAKNDE